MTRHDTPDAARRRFFEAALRVCADKGFVATRMADIAAAAGRSKGALYHHFPTKKALFVELVHDLVEQFTTSVDEGMLADAKARDLIERSLTSLVESFGGLELFRVFVELLPLAARDLEIRVPLLKYYNQGMNTLAALLSWGQRRGQLRPGFDAMKVARALTLGRDGIYMIGTALGESDRVFEDVRELFARVFDGLELPDATP